RRLWWGSAHLFSDLAFSWSSTQVEKILPSLYHTPRVFSKVTSMEKNAVCRRVSQGYKTPILFSHSKRELISHFTCLLCSFPTYLWTMPLPEGQRNKNHSY
uniref:Uncharacterized protein n=1 Tax=Serinus canaria TaxID=9135 RepID=A0A8C9N787_SERCA